MAPSTRQRNHTLSKKDVKRIAARKAQNAPKAADYPLGLHPDDLGLVYPSGDTAFKALLSARFCAAIWSNISDCDETYNFWEPSHYLLFGKGFQTWEYSPEYALRSYTYLMVNMVPAWLYSRLLQTNRLLIFYFCRCLFGLVCALCEAYFYRAVCREFGVQVGRIMLAFLVFSAGMFIASTAYLPSTFSMYMTLLSIGAWYQRKYELAILATALSTFLSWPFAALVGLPIALDMVFRKQEILRFIRGSAIAVVVIVPVMVWLDSQYYGHLVFPPVNIVLYNIFTSHGPDLYGTEPWNFYFINAFINFNFVAVGALLTPIALVFLSMLVKSQPRHPSCLPYWLSLMPLYLWCFVFFNQPHKEERFLFPVYPLVCLSGALTVDVIQKLWFRFLVDWRGKGTSRGRKPLHYLNHTMPILVAALLVCSVLGLSRILALYKGYHAPMDILMELSRLDADDNLPGANTMNVCVGKEWHRFPSSFFLPDDRFQLRFIQSEFRGQLPAPYSSSENATSIIPENMNSENREEPSRYFPIEKCHFLFDVDLGKQTPLEPNYAAQTESWVVVKSLQYLNAAKSNQFLRAFYVPYLTNQYCEYASYYLLLSRRLLNSGR